MELQVDPRQQREAGTGFKVIYLKTVILQQETQHRRTRHKLTYFRERSNWGLREFSSAPPSVTESSGVSQDQAYKEELIEGKLMTGVPLAAWENQHSHASCLLYIRKTKQQKHQHNKIQTKTTRVTLQISQR